MIATDADAALTALLARLKRQAAALAEARAEAARMARRDDARRWRRPDLLWPLFTRGV